MNLYQLSKTILLLNKAPINKVRFARVVYFVHKELIRKKFMSPEDIAYIRSPLGPVPDGFLRLTLEHPNIITSPNPNRPSFAAEEYAITTEGTEETTMLEQYRDILNATEKTLKALAAHTTPELVEASHADPSWITNFNGARFFITPADLKNTFPFNTIRIKIRLKPSPNELGALQANLLRGMIQDIVKESTDLEYPDQTNNSTPASKSPIKKPTTSSKTSPKLNPLDLLTTLPFLKRPKSSKSSPNVSITKKPSSATTTNTNTNTNTNAPTAKTGPKSPPKPEHNPNKTREGTK